MALLDGQKPDAAEGHIPFGAYLAGKTETVCTGEMILKDNRYVCLTCGTWKPAKPGFDGLFAALGKEWRDS